MEYRLLGKTGIKVSLLSLGTLPLGPLQANLPLQIGAGIIRQALRIGINLIDTAEIYGTYTYIEAALRKHPAGALHELPTLVASRSYAATSPEMQRSVEKALQMTARSCIELFMLHQQESEHTLRGHEGALRYLVEAKEKGMIKAVGISTHHIRAVRAILTREDIDFVFAPLNSRGLGIQDGTAVEMMEALMEAHRGGKGTIVMKPIGGGHLWREVEEEIRMLRELPFVTSINMGFQSVDELNMDCHLIERKPVPDALKSRINKKSRRLHIEDCQGCGKCVARCPAGALKTLKNIATVCADKCVLCGYCASVCPEFCIKVL